MDLAEGRNFLQCIDLLSDFKSSICTTLKNLDGVNQNRFSLCPLKLNKKRASGDLIIPGFFRACCTSGQQNGRDNVTDVSTLKTKTTKLSSTTKILSIVIS